MDHFIQRIYGQRVHFDREVLPKSRIFRLEVGCLTCKQDYKAARMILSEDLDYRRVSLYNDLYTLWEEFKFKHAHGQLVDLYVHRFR